MKEANADIKPAGDATFTEHYKGPLKIDNELQMWYHLMNLWPD